MYARPARDQMDPWWEYPTSMGPAAAGSLDRLRKSVRE
jgi:hypothetical protein